MQNKGFILMKNEKKTCNLDKENATFAVKLRSLVDERGITQQALTDYVNSRTGETLSRQSVGQWIIGTSCPPLRTVPIIAEYFGVSTDYLLTDTSTRTTNPTIKSATILTGLSEKAIDSLQIIKARGINEITAAVNYLLEEFRGDMEIRCFLGDFIESGYSTHFLVKLSKYLNTTAKGNNGNFCVSADGKLVDTKSKQLEEIKALSGIEDKTGVCIISKDELINKLLFDDVVDALKELKRTYHGQPTEAFTRSEETEKEK